MTDGGGIYLFSNTAGSDDNPNIIRENYVSHGWHGVTAYCLDYDVSNITFESNVNDSFNNSNNIDAYAKEWSNGWIPYDFNIGSTNSSLIFRNNYGTNGYAKDENAQNCTVENHTVGEFGVWNDDAKEIIRNAGVEEEYLLNMSDFPREIEMAELVELNVGEKQKISLYAFDEKENIYNSQNIDIYCYSFDENIISVEDNDTLLAKTCGDVKIKVIVKCGTVLRERIITVTVK